MYPLFSCLVLEWAAMERFYIWKDKLMVVLRCVQLFQAAVQWAERNLKVVSRPEIFRGLLLLCSFFYKVSLQWLASHCHSQSPGCPRTAVRYLWRITNCWWLRNAIGCSVPPEEMFVALQTDGGSNPTGLLPTPGGWFGFLCELRVRAFCSQGSGLSFQFGADGVGGRAGTSGGGAASLVLRHFLLRLKWTPHPITFSLA